jgi:hypothetical protein
MGPKKDQDWTGLDRFFNRTMVAVALNVPLKDWSWLQVDGGKKTA